MLDFFIVKNGYEVVFLSPRPPAFLAGLGADSATAGAAAGSSPPVEEQPLQRQRGEQPLPRRGRRCGGAARVLDACLVLGRCSSVLLVFESALDNLGLGATAGALNPLDVLVILVGCEDCLQLRVCDLNESGFIWVYTSTIALSC